jgi:hypothetical protein
MKYPHEFSLCIVRKNERLVIQEGITEFAHNSLHRVLFDADRKGCIVYGFWMSIEDYEKNFIDYAILTKERLTRMNLIENGKLISFKEFKERVYIVGRGYINVHLYRHPKESVFSFYPWGTSNKIDGLKTSYKMLVDASNGIMDDFDVKYLRWGNGGLPLGGGYVSRDEYAYLKEFNVNV